MVVGALAGGRLARVGFARVWVTGFAVAAVAWAAALVAPTLAATAALLAVALVPVGVTNVLAATMIQRMVPDDFLGRVSALLGSASEAVMPVGSLAGGLLGETVGVWTTMALGAVGLASVAAYILAVPSLRRLPPVAEVTTLEA